MYATIIHGKSNGGVYKVSKYMMVSNTQDFSGVPCACPSRPSSLFVGPGNNTIFRYFWHGSSALITIIIYYSFYHSRTAMPGNI